MQTPNEAVSEAVQELSVTKTRLEFIHQLGKTCPALSTPTATRVMAQGEADLFEALNALRANQYDAAAVKLNDVITKVNYLSDTLANSLNPVLQPGEQFASSLKNMIYSVRRDLARSHTNAREYGARLQ